MARARLTKDVGLPGQQPLFPKERLNDMPLAKGRVAKASLVFKSDATSLVLRNLEEPIAWKLGIMRLTKAAPAVLAKAFDPAGSRHMRAFKDVPAAPDLAPGSPAMPAADAAAAIDGSAEFGLQTDDAKEYFLSKFGDLVGIITVKRGPTGWSAGLSKSNVPRVLSKEAVSEGMMPPSGHSALPKSLEAVVPQEFHYWNAATPEEAVQMRDALVESDFFNDDCVKAVDGELRKVEVKYYLYEPGQALEMRATTFADKVQQVIPPALASKAHTPMASEDWLEALDKGDAAGSLAILSPADRSVSAREMVRAAKTLKGDFLLEHNDTRPIRAAFAAAGRVFKLHGLPDRVFCASFALTKNGDGMSEMDDGPVVKTIDFQGLKVDIDRPAGFTQTGKDAQGNDWSRTYQYDYGFFPGTKGGDGDAIDVFVGPNTEAPNAYWVTQKKDDGSFDEYKVFVGFGGERDALEAYKAHIPTKYFDGITEVPVGALKGMLGLDPQPMAKRLFEYVRKIEGVSYDQLRCAVNDALKLAFPPDQDDDSCCSPCGYYCDDLYDDHAIFYKDGKTYSINFTYSNGTVTFAGQPTEVKRTVTYEPAGGAGPGAGAPGSAAGTTPPNQKRLANEKRGLLEVAKRTLRIALTKDDAVAASPDAHYVLGIVLEPDVVDAQNDTYSADEVRQASERFMEVHRNMGLMHKQKVNDKVQILENFIAPVDMQIGDEQVKKGTWLMGVRVNDPTLWSDVKLGKLTGFSIGGSAIRKPVEEGV